MTPSLMPDREAAEKYAREFTDPDTAWQRTQAVVQMRVKGHDATADAMEEAVIQA